MGRTLVRKSAEFPELPNKISHFFMCSIDDHLPFFSHENFTEAGSLKTASPKLKTDVLALESYHLRHKGQYDLRGTVKLCPLKCPSDAEGTHILPLPEMRQLGTGRGALKLIPTLRAHSAGSMVPSPIQFLNLEVQPGS